MNNIWNEKIVYSPSLICLDMCNLQDQVKELEQSGIKMLHVDILDGHFSPSMPLGLEAVRQLRRLTSMEFDVHVMAISNDYFIDELLDIGVQQIIFHVETEAHVDNQINRIKNKGVRAGVALKPTTSLSELDYIIEKCDTILLMLINPGYAGSASEKQVVYADRKIKELKKLINSRGLNTLIEVDGRISKENIKIYGKEYVDVFVAGSTCISKENIRESVMEIQNIRKNILAGNYNG